MGDAYKTDNSRVGILLETTYAPVDNGGQQTGNWYQVLAGSTSGGLDVKVPVCTTSTLNGNACTKGHAKITLHAGMLRNSILPVAFNGDVNSSMQVSIVYP